MLHCLQHKRSGDKNALFSPRCKAYKHETPTSIYCTELATEEKTLLALEPISRMVPTTITKITASITAYSAISCPCCSDHSLRRKSVISRASWKAGGGNSTGDYNCFGLPWPHLLGRNFANQRLAFSETGSLKSPTHITPMYSDKNDKFLRFHIFCAVMPADFVLCGIVSQMIPQVSQGFEALLGEKLGR